MRQPMRSLANVPRPILLLALIMISGGGLRSVFPEPVAAQSRFC